MQMGKRTLVYLPDRLLPPLLRSKRGGQGERGGLALFHLSRNVRQVSH